MKVLIWIKAKPFVFQNALYIINKMMHFKQVGDAVGEVQKESNRFCPKQCIR